MNNSQRQLKTENFKTFDKYYLLPEDKTIKKWIDTFQIHLEEESMNQQSQFYCKFSNRLILQIFLVLLAGKSLQDDFIKYSFVKNILPRYQKVWEYNWEQLTIQKVKELHKQLKQDIKKYKNDYMDLKEESISQILEELKAKSKLSYIIVDEREVCQKKNNNKEEIQIIQFDLPNYFILGIFQRQKLKMDSQEEKQGKQNLNNSNSKIIQKEVVFMKNLNCHFSVINKEEKQKIGSAKQTNSIWDRRQIYFSLFLSLIFCFIFLTQHKYL